MSQTESQQTTDGHPAEDTRFGRCESTAKSTGKQCGRAATGPHGKCDIHGGKSPGGKEGNNGGAPKENKNAVGNNGGAPDNNGNAQSHGLFSNPSKLYKRLDHEEQMRVNSIAVALAFRVERVRGDVDEFDRFMCERLGVRLYQLEMAEDWMGEKGDETGHSLIESYIIGQREDKSPIEVEAPNQIIDALKTLSNDARMWMKDLGLLDPPESDFSDSVETLAGAIKESNR